MVIRLYQVVQGRRMYLSEWAEETFLDFSPDPSHAFEFGNEEGADDVIEMAARVWKVELKR